MSNKPHDKLNELDKKLRSTYLTGMLHGTRFLIRQVIGFELFNTRPYHNYETWSDGYEATDGRVYATAEDLDDCINKLCSLATKPDSELEAWERAPEDLSSWIKFAELDMGK